VSEEVPVSALEKSPDIPVLQQEQFQLQTPARMRRILLRERQVLERDFQDRLSIIDAELAKLDEIEKNG
jgi:hypothetical protein